MKRSTADLLFEGLMAGLLGALAVALFFGFVNLLDGRSFFWTAAILGQALVGGPPAPGSPLVTAAPVFAYTGLHLLLFVALGLGASWLVVVTERHPVLWYLVLFFGVVLLFNLTFAAVLLRVTFVGGAIPWSLMTAATLVGALVMTLWFARLHPGLSRLVEEQNEAA